MYLEVLLFLSNKKVVFVEHLPIDLIWWFWAGTICKYGHFFVMNIKTRSFWSQISFFHCEVSEQSDVETFATAGRRLYANSWACTNKSISLRQSQCSKTQQGVWDFWSNSNQRLSTKFAFYSKVCFLLLFFFFGKVSALKELLLWHFWHCIFK